MANDLVDVLIIGAGASGAAVAWSLAETRMRILCLEQGDWIKQSEYPSNHRDWESKLWGNFSISPNRRNGTADYPINDRQSPIAVANFNAVGGSTILYAGHFPRFHPSDFRVKTLDGVGEDWPISYTTLEPFYDENDRMTGVSGLAGDPAYPPKPQIMPPVPLGRSGECLARGFNKLGWHWWPSDTAIATKNYAGRAQCINLGACYAGCAQGAKATTDITYWPEALRRGVELRTRCRVSQITVNQSDMATGVLYFDEEGREHFQPAEVVIVACNGVGTPRLLLNSSSAKFPSGLANRNGLVGKNLMFHPYSYIQGVFDDPLDGHAGPGVCILSQEFYETDRKRGFVRGFTFECSRGRGAISTAMSGLQNGMLDWGHDHHRQFRILFKRVTGMSGICEDLPEEQNTVTLDPDLTDRDGIPAPMINYKLSENSKRMLDFSVERATEVLQAAGAHSILVESPIAAGGWHLMGTARMGADPERSIVNEWGRSHDVKNLFVVDGSVFVTSAGVNPTRTIQAIALYVAGTIKKRLDNLFD